MLLRVMGRGLGLLLCCLAVGMMCLGPIRDAEAAPRWQIIREYSWDEIAAAGFVKPVYNDPSILMADMRWVNEDWSALLLNAPADRAYSSPQFYDGRPFTTVFAVYDEQTATGRIQLVRSILTGDRRLVVMTAPFRPHSMTPKGPLPLPTVRWDTDWPDQGIGDLDFVESTRIRDGANWNYGRSDEPIYNPFADFAGHPDGMTFIHIQPAAFYSAVGWAMRYAQATHAWVANLVSKDEIRKKKSGTAFRKKVRITKKTWVTPQWMLAVPGGIMNTGADSYAFCFPALECGDQYGNGRTSKARTLMAGVNFQVEGVGNNLPHTPYLAFQHSRTYAGWTFLTMIIFTAVLAASVAGAVAAFGGPNFAAAIGLTGQAGGYGGVGAAAWAGAGAGALTNASWNYLNGVHSLTDTVNRVFASGKSDIDSMRAAVNEWDSRPFVRAMVEAGPLNTPGATSEFFITQKPAEWSTSYGRRLWPNQPRPVPYDPYTGQPLDQGALTSVTPAQPVMAPPVAFGTPVMITSLADSAWVAHVDAQSNRPYQQAAVTEGTLYVFSLKETLLQRPDGTVVRGSLSQIPGGRLMFSPYVDQGQIP